MINKIIEECEVEIDIEDDGSVFVTSVTKEGMKKALKWIKDITRKIEAGEVFTGKVVRMLEIGVFVEILPGRDGMVHVSELAPYRVSKPADFMELGDTVTVRVKEIDDQGRINLSMKGLKENEALWKEEKGKDTGGGFSGGRSRFNGPRGGGKPYNNRAS